MISLRGLAHLFAALLLVTLARPAIAKPPRVSGEPVARISITLARNDAGVALVPGPFAALPNGRIAIYLAESSGILLLEGDRILHHFPLPSVDRGLGDLVADGTMLVAGHRPRGMNHVELFVLDLSTGRTIHRVQSANPFLRAPESGEDRWRVVVAGDLVGAFDPSTAASYPLWDRVAGVVAGSEQVVRATSGLGFGEKAVWIPQPDGSVARKVRGRSEPFTTPEEGEFVDASDDVVVLLQNDREARARNVLPKEFVVHVLEEEHAISELRLPAVSPDVGNEPRAFSGRPVQLHDGRLVWVYVGYDYLEFRTAALPPRSGG